MYTLSEIVVRYLLYYKYCFTALYSNIAPVQRSFTKNGDKVGTAVVNAYSIGRVLIVSYYLILTASIARLEPFGEFNIPSTFVQNWFTKEGVNLAKGTKALLADTALASGTTLYGQIVGVF